MKSFIVILILTLFWVGSIHSDDHCFLESQRQNLMQKNCMDSIFSSANFLPLANQAIVDYDGDNDAVHRFSHEYCPILARVINCLPLGLNISEECRTPLLYESDAIRFRALGVMLHWACDNGASNLIDVLQESGLKTFMFSNEFHQCGQILSETPVYDRNTTTFVINPEYCAALGTVLECYKNLVRAHKNRNLVRLAGDLHERIRAEWGC